MILVREEIKMDSVLFNGLEDVSNEEVISRMKEYADEAKRLMKLYEEDKRTTVALARELRNNLKAEYKNNDLLRIQKIYKNHELFLGYYKPAVAEAYVKTTGQLTNKNVYSFLYDVVDYMRYYIPKKYK